MNVKAKITKSLLAKTFIKYL